MSSGVKTSISDIAAKAFSEARKRVLASGQSVLQREPDGWIYRVFPDGKKEPIKHVGPPIPSIPGAIFQLTKNLTYSPI